MYLPNPESGRSCWHYHHLCSQETLVQLHRNLLGSVLVGENQRHKTLTIPVDEAAQASLQSGKIVESVAVDGSKAEKDESTIN